MSYIDQPGEWENRRISIIGAAKSIISQLTVGQDMTKISLPAVFQHPYSALELGAHRALSFCHLIYDANKEEDAIHRLFSAIKWYLTCTRKERFEKKPYNPILGECHFSWVESEENGRTSYLAEQTMHHPPLCSYVVENSKEGMHLQGNIAFAIHFHGNSVSVGTSGPIKMKLSQRNEEYNFSSVFPNLSIRNVIIGTKRLSWEGTVTITCPQTGYQATLFYKEEGWYCTNVVNGTIVKIDAPDQPLYTIYGACGGKIEITDCKTNQVELFFDYGTQVANKLRYPPFEILEERSSLKLWREVSNAIYVDDQPKADVAKRLIEEAQRKRRATGSNFVPRFFEFNKESNFWESNHSSFQRYVRLMFEQLEAWIEANNGQDSSSSSLEDATQNLTLNDKTDQSHKQKTAQTTEDEETFALEHL